MPLRSTSVDDEDATLLARVADGDLGPPLEELYRRYEHRLFGLGLHLLGDRGLAEELVQETFVRLWRTADRFDPERGSVPTYVMAIARRLAIDLWRRPSSRPFVPPPPVGDDDGDPPDPSDPVDSLMTRLVVREAMEALTPAHREVLDLLHGRSLKQTEIAEMLGIPLGTVKTRVYYALRALKLALDERGIHG
jgi:RNA polymerase sigma-70 factor (ECF subfamily)